MGSINYGKSEITMLILNEIEKGKEVLDVGACDGKWFKILGPYYTMDAVEVFTPNIVENHLESMYRNVYNCDIKDFEYDHYDVIVFGDVIEHMTVEDAQYVLDYAKKHADLVVVGVPFLWPQGKCYGNDWEEHIQEDLTHDLFMERYPGFELFMKQENYGWYIYRTPSDYLS